MHYAVITWSLCGFYVGDCFRNSKVISELREVSDRFVTIRNIYWSYMIVYYYLCALLWYQSSCTSLIKKKFFFT